MLAPRLCRGYLRSCSRVWRKGVQVSLLGAMTGATAMPRLPTIQSLRSLVVEDGLCPHPQTSLMHYMDQQYDQFYLDIWIDTIITLRHRRRELFWTSRRCRAWRTADHRLHQLMDMLEKRCQMEPSALDRFHPLGATAMPRLLRVVLPGPAQSPARPHLLGEDGAGHHGRRRRRHRELCLHHSGLQRILELSRRWMRARMEHSSWERVTLAPRLCRGYLLSSIPLLRSRNLEKSLRPFQRQRSSRFRLCTTMCSKTPMASIRPCTPSRWRTS